MADIYRKFLEDQAVAARKNADALIAASNQAKADAEAFERSLEAYTRSPLGSRDGADMAGIPTMFEPPAANGKPTKQNKGKEWDVTLDTKAGVLRNIFLSTNRDLSIDSMLKYHPKGASVTVDRNDIYRMLPRFTQRGEVERVARGVFRYLKRSEIQSLKEA